VINVGKVYFICWEYVSKSIFYVYKDRVICVAAVSENKVLY